MASLTQQAKKVLLQADGAPAMKRAAPEPMKQLARSAPRSAPGSGRSFGPRFASDEVKGIAVSRGRNGGSESSGARFPIRVLGGDAAPRGRIGGSESRESDDMMESVRTVGLEPSDAEEQQEGHRHHFAALRLDAGPLNHEPIGANRTVRVEVQVDRRLARYNATATQLCAAVAPNGAAR